MCTVSGAVSEEAVVCVCVCVYVSLRYVVDTG